MKKTDRIYLSSIVLSLVCIIVLTAAAYYMYGVVDRNKIGNKLEQCAEVLSENLESSLSSDNNEIIKEITDEYSSKTRTVSLVMKNYGSNSFDVFLEEMRVAIGAEEISISDSKGNITDSTNMYSEGAKIKDTFLEHLKDTVYTESTLVETENGYRILSATKRSNNKGMIQVTYLADNIVDKVGTTQLYSYINEASVISGISLAVINVKTNKYVINSNASLEKSLSDIPKEKYKKESGKFTAVISGVNSFVYYKKVSLNKSDEYVIISYVPNISTKKMCTVVAEWVFAVCFIVSAVLILSFRSSILKINSEKNKEKSKKNNG